MASGHGGPRTPRNPAPVSGPGRLSRRTDGGPSQKLMAPTGMGYGDRQALLNQERTAPMSQADTPPALSVPKAPTPTQATDGGGYPGPGMNTPSQRPWEPVTAGVDTGPGPGPEAMQLPGPGGPRPDGYVTNTLAQLSNSDTTGTLAQLYLMAQQRGV